MKNVSESERTSWGKNGPEERERKGEDEGRELESKGHSCRGLMPRVEKLEPRNVPQRPLMREVRRREGVERKTSHRTHIGLVLHNPGLSRASKRCPDSYDYASALHVKL